MGLATDNARFNSSLDFKFPGFFFQMIFDYHALVLEPTQRVVEKRYQLLPDSIGEGAHSTVWLAKDKAGNFFVIKRLPTHMVDEVGILKQLDHPNICRLIEDFAPSKSDPHHICIALEYCAGGELFDRIASGGLDDAQCRRILRQLASALSYCHARGVVHGDVKPENVMCMDFHEYADTVKLIDFGLARRRGDGVKRFFTTEAYAAPEVLSGDAAVGELPASDMWSLGVVLYVMLFGRLPGFKNGLVIPRELPVRLETILKSLLTHNVTERMTASDLLGHPWMQESTTLHVVKVGQNDLASLRRFATHSPLHRAIAAISAKKLNFAELNRLHDLFVKLDKDKDGCLSLDEFLGAFVSTGISNSEVKLLFSAADSNGSGRVEYSEFLAATFGHLKSDQEKLIRASFDYIDKTSTGFISISNLSAFLDSFDLSRELGDSQIADLKKKLEISSVEKIDFETFAEWVLAK